ncbi:MAG: TetR family transcriptional regulator [Acidobacteriota bacterium]|nr:TetR family transcriptional regulator [Acidobacteriota bacterium]
MFTLPRKDDEIKIDDVDRTPVPLNRLSGIRATRSLVKVEKPLRSQAARDRILTAARALFGELGFERCTVRLVADQAKIHSSLVMRYFGSKEGLFAAAVKFDLHLPDLALVPADGRGEALVRHFLGRWEGADSGEALPSLLRIAATHSEARKMLFEIFERQLAPVIGKIARPGRSKVSAALVATQAIGLAYTRYVLEIPAVVLLSKEQLVSSMGATFQRYIDIE